MNKKYIWRVYSGESIINKVFLHSIGQHGFRTMKETSHETHNRIGRTEILLQSDVDFMDLLSPPFLGVGLEDSKAVLVSSGL